MGLPDRYTANLFLLCKWVCPNLPNKEWYWFFFQSITGFRIWTGAPFGFLPNSRWIILSGSHLRFPNKLGHGLNMLRLKQEKTDFTGWWYTYPSKNMKVRWDDYPQYMENNKCSKPPTIFWDWEQNPSKSPDDMQVDQLLLGGTNQEAGTLFQGTQRMPSAQNKTPWKSQLGFTSSPLETSAAKRQM